MHIISIVLIQEKIHARCKLIYTTYSEEEIQNNIEIKNFVGRRAIFSYTYAFFSIRVMTKCKKTAKYTPTQSYNIMSITKSDLVVLLIYIPLTRNDLIKLLFSIAFDPELHARDTTAVFMVLL